ncbi:MAG: argininosuccinate lyase, partial [Alphaproteobacteria bacterium]
VLTVALPAMTGLIAGMTVRVERLARDAADGFTLATEVADHLARQGLPFAEAHEVTGALVRYCEDMGKTLETLDAKDLAAVDERLDATLLAKLTVDAAIASRSGPGGTAPSAVAAQLAGFREAIAKRRPFTELGA